MRRPSLSITVLMLVVLVILAGFSSSAWALSGSGTAADPYIIGSLADFDEFANPANSATYWAGGVYTRLMCDIDLAGRTYSKAVIAPDTDNSTDWFQGTAFASIFNGNGHVIRNLNINATAAGNDYLALFGKLEGATAEIKNLGLENINITCGDNTFLTGALCAVNKGLVSCCYAFGTLTGTESSHYAGGLCGSNNQGTIDDCYAACAVSSHEYTGGLCGINTGTVTNCYSTSAVAGTGSSGSTGGLCGSNTGTIFNCFWDTQTSGQTTSAGGTGKTTQEMQTRSTFTNARWDFYDEFINGTQGYWQLPVAGGYPLLSVFVRLSGSGTIGNPYLIKSPSDFDTFSARCNADHYWTNNVHTKLMCNINLAGRTYTSAVIAPDTDNTIDWFQGVVFAGVFDGNNHVIKNLTIDTVGTGNSCSGFFGKMEGSMTEIKNLGIENASITAGNVSHLAGALCGVNKYGIISHCYAVGKITVGADDSQYTGGLCGSNNQGSIDNCYATCGVSGYACVGGLCGINTGTVNYCYSTGNVRGQKYVGDLCGFNSHIIINSYATGNVTVGTNSVYSGGLCGGNTGIISDCYATGIVTGGNYSWGIGGLCGFLEMGSISNCYSTGRVVTAGDARFGGLCGYRTYGSITNSFWDIETSGIGSASDDNYGATGKTTTQMQTKSTFTNARWDFDYIWKISDGNDYPRLTWQFWRGDFNKDDNVNLYDFAVISDAWLSTVGDDSYNADCDLSGDNTIDMADLVIMTQNWLKGSYTYPS